MKYNFIGYGSLISHKSLMETISNKKFKPIIVNGYKRIFDLALSKKKNEDVLNIEKSKEHKFNAVLFKVSDLELTKIKMREPEYNLEEVIALDFFTNKKLCKAIIDIDHLIKIDKTSHLPAKSYFILCREAAYHISKEFGKMWDETTFTASNQKITDFLKEHKNFNTIG